MILISVDRIFEDLQHIIFLLEFQQIYNYTRVLYHRGIDAKGYCRQLENA